MKRKIRSITDEYLTALAKEVHNMKTRKDVTSNASHTPTPWRIFDSPYGIGLGKDNSDTQIYYFKTVEEAIAKLADLAPNQIVRAVNSHETLIEAIRLAMATIHRLDEDTSSTRGTLDVLHQALKIAKAEGNADADR